MFSHHHASNMESPNSLLRRDFVPTFDCFTCKSAVPIVSAYAHIPRCYRAFCMAELETDPLCTCSECKAFRQHPSPVGTPFDFKNGTLPHELNLVDDGQVWEYPCLMLPQALGPPFPCPLSAHCRWGHHQQQHPQHRDLQVRASPPSCHDPASLSAQHGPWRARRVPSAITRAAATLHSH